MSGPGSDVAAWARAHEASFEVEPLIEMVKGRRVQVGFTISLAARLPMKEGPRVDRWVEAAEIRAGLHQIVNSLTPPEGSRARVEIQSPRAAVYFAPAGEMEPEIALDARVFHGDDYFAEVTAGEESRLHQVTRRLVEMGLKERRRRIP